MGVICEKGVITAPGATGNQTYNLGSAFDGVLPKAVVLWATRDTTDPATLVGGNVNWSMGFGTYDGGVVQNVGIFAYETDGAGTAACDRGLYTDGILKGVATDVTSAEFVASLVSLNSGTPSTFVINWSDIPAAQIKVHYLVLGGTDIAAARVGSFQMAVTTDPQNVTISAGWGKPDALLFLSNGTNTLLSGGASFCAFGASVADVGQWYATYKSLNGATAMDVAGTLTNDSLIGYTAGVVLDARATLAAKSAFPTDGFQLGWPDTSGFAGYVGYLALRGTMTVAVGSGTAPTAGGLPVSQTLTGAVGSTAKGAFIASAGLPASTAVTTTDARLGQFMVGGWDGTNEGVASILIEDANTTAICGRDFTSGKTVRLLDMNAGTGLPVLQAEAGGTLSGADAILSWNDIDSVATDYRYVIFGEVAAPSTDIKLTMPPYQGAF